MPFWRPWRPRVFHTRSFMKRGLLALLGLAVPSAWVLHVNHDISQGKTISETDLYFLSHLPLRKFSRVVGTLFVYKHAPTHLACPHA